MPSSKGSALYLPSSIFTPGSEERGGVSSGGGRGRFVVGSFAAYLSHFTIDHASLSRRSVVPTPKADTSNPTF